MVSSGKGRIFRRKDGKYLIYLPKDLAEDSQFPFPLKEQGLEDVGDSLRVKVSFKIGVAELLIEKLVAPNKPVG